MRGTEHTRHAKQNETVVLSFCQIDIRGMEGHADAQPTDLLRPDMGRERLLTCCRAYQGVPGMRKGDDKRVAHLLRFVAVEACEYRAQQPVMVGQRNPEDVSARLPEASRAFDIGQEESHRAGREGRRSGRDLGCLLPGRRVR
jgi:hypothetical protein